MASGRIIVPEWMPARDSDGVPIPDAEIFVYLNRTTTLVPVYSDAALTVPLTNPVEANSSGQFPSIWQEDTNLFSVSVFSPSLGVLATLDDVRVSSSAGGGGVSSVNGDAGPAVVLDATDVGAIPLSQKGAPSGVASLGGDGKVPAAQLPVDGSYKGSWNATTNTPTIASGVGVNGDYYIVGVAGTTTIDGISSWAVNDQLRFNGTVWEKFASTATVSSVNSKVGAVVLNAADVGAPTTSGAGVNASAFRTALGATVSGAAMFMAADVAAQRTLLGLAGSATKDFGVPGGTAAWDDPRFNSASSPWIRPELPPYNAVGNGSFTAATGTDDSAAIQSAYNDAVAQNKTVLLSKIHRINATITATLNAYPNRFHMTGIGRGQCGLTFTSNAQLSITGNFGASGEYDGPLVQLEGFTVRTGNQSSTSPIKITYTGGSGTTPVSCVVQDLDISGINGTCGFKYGIECFNARNALFRDIRILGDRTVIDNNPGSKAVLSQGGIYVGGDSDPVDVTFENVEIYYVQDSYTVAGAFEGVIWDGCTTVNTNWFIKDRRGSGVADPLFQIMNCHANTWSGILDSENRFQSAIVGNLFYNFGGYPNWVGLRFVNSIGQPTDTSIVGNTFFVFSSGCTAIDVSGSAGDDTIIIDANNFNGTVPISVGINLGTGANRVLIPDTNTFASCTTPIAGNLANNKVEQSIFNVGSGVATMLGAGASENKLPFSELALPASIYPTTSGTRTLGTASLRWSAVWGVDASFSGTATVANFGATGTSTFNGPAGFNGGFNVTTGAAISGNTTIGGSLTVAGNIQANGGISIASGQSIGQAGGAVYIRDTLYPVTDNTAYCGGGSNRWIAVYAVTGTIQTSDPRLKDMTPIDYDEAERLLFAIQPVSYRWKKDRAKEHMGFDAEEVFEAFQSEGRTDFGGVTERTDDTPMGLNYAELVPVLWAQVRYLTSRLEALERLND